MTDFDGLLPPRRTCIPPLPERGGPAAIVGIARDRRRAQAARTVGATSAASLAIAGVVALRPAPGTHGIVEAPATKPPSAAPTTRTPRPDASRGPGVGTPAPSGSASPTAATRAPAGTTTTPAAPAGTARPTATTPPSPLPPLDREVSPYTRVERTFVPDPDPGNNCFRETSVNSPGALFCTRTIAPERVKSGQPVRFLFQACAYTGTDQTIRFAGAAEAQAFIITETSDGTYWDSRAPQGGAAHDMVIPDGQCAQYTIFWDGLGNDGEPLAPGLYMAVSQMIGNGGPTEISDDTFEIT